MAALLHIASIPGAGRGLIEGRYGPECHVHLILVECSYFSQVIHKGVVVFWRQVVQLAVHVSTAGQSRHWPPVLLCSQSLLVCLVAFVLVLVIVLRWWKSQGVESHQKGRC